MEEAKSVEHQTNEETVLREKVGICHHAIKNHLTILLAVSDRLLKSDLNQELTKELTTLKTHAENINDEINVFRSYFVKK